MPSLTPEDQERLLGTQEWKCDKCGRHPERNYCRECDEFFFVCGCPPEPEDKDGQYHSSRYDHRGHRTY
jgi:hypothetical protein